MPNSEVLDLTKQLKKAISAFKVKKKWSISHTLELMGDMIELAVDAGLRDSAELMERLRRDLGVCRDRKSQTKAKKKNLLEQLARIEESLQPQEETEEPASAEEAPESTPPEEASEEATERETEESPEAAFVDEVEEVSAVDEAPTEKLEVEPAQVELQSDDLEIDLEMDDELDLSLDEPEETEQLSPEPEPEPEQPQTLEDILRAAFIEEASAAFPEMRASMEKFTELESAEDKAKALEPAFRAAHSIKGAARAIELYEAEMLAASLEKSLRSAAKPETSYLDADSLACVWESIDMLSKVADSFKDNSIPPSLTDLKEVVEKLDAVKGMAPPTAEPVSPEGEEDDLGTLLREGFTTESKEHFPLIKEGVALFPIADLETGEAVVESLVGSVESLNEAAKAAGFSDLTPLLESLGELFAGVKADKNFELSGEALKTVNRAVTLAEKIASAYSGEGKAPSASQSKKMLSALRLLQTVKRKRQAKAEPSLEPVKAVKDDSQQVALKAAFLEEAESFKKDYFGGLKLYAKTSTPQERVDALKPVFRAVHTLRGSARAVDLTQAEILCSTLEQIFRLATQPHRSYLATGDVGALESAGEALVASIDAYRDGSRGPTRARIRKVLEALERISPGAPEQSIEMVVKLEDVEPEVDPQDTLQALFREEAEDYILSLNQLLVEFEKHQDDESAYEILEKVFRDVHSLKGASRSVGLEKVESVCQGLETVYSKLKRQEIALSQAALDVSFRGVDTITQLLDGAPVSEDELTELALQMQKVADDKTAAPMPRAKKAKPVKASQAPVAAAPPTQERETVRLQVNKLDGLLLQAEEMLTIKLKATQRATELRELEDNISGWDRQYQKVAPALGKLRDTSEELDPVFDFISWSQKYIRNLESQVKLLHRSSVQDERTTRGLVDNILEDAKQLLLFPFNTLLERFPRLVRDLGRELNKEVDFQVSGQGIEIDRRILDELRDPLTHLVRNGVDHGLETTKQRRAAGKPARGRLEINVSRETAEHILVEIRDDGHGIDAAKLRKKAVAKGLYTKDEAAKLSDQDVQELIFLSDFSTAEKVTEVSGRGLGMPIVAEKVHALGGSVSVRSELGKGTRFLLRLPIRRATYNGILVSSGGETVVIPTTSVVSVHRFDFERDVKTLEGQATVEVRGRVVPIVRLEEVLGFKTQERAFHSQFLLAVMLEFQNNWAAFIVDELIAEQEILAKKPSFPLNKVPTLAGSTILGNGRVAPILNVAALIEPLVKATIRSTREEVAPARPKADNYKILLCDDSITSRTLLTHILSNAGYNVTAKMDGAQAYEALLEGEYDLLCSDVEMPNMTGLELCAKVRETAGFEDLPIVLITTLDDPEDHQAGADAGASAYVVKGRLDQDHLLETVEFLL